MAANLCGKPIVTDNLVLCLDAGNARSINLTGATWYDLSGKGNDATIHSSTYTSGVDGVDGYFNFNGSSDYIKIDDSSDFLMGTGSFTEEAWHKRDGNINWEAPMSRYTSGSWGGLWMTGANGFRPYHYSSEGSSIDFATGEAVGTDWVHHVTTTTNTGSAVTIKVYANGALRATQSTTVSGWQPKGTSVGDSDVYIGGNMAGYYYEGKIAVCRVYKGRALTATEVLQNYDALKGRYH